MAGFSGASDNTWRAEACRGRGSSTGGARSRIRFMKPRTSVVIACSARWGPSYDVYECLGHDVDVESRVVGPNGEFAECAESVEFHTPVTPFGGRGLDDYWEVDQTEQKVVRHHVCPRTTLFTPFRGWCS